MIDVENLPKSNVGLRIGGVHLENALAERICLEDRSIMGEKENRSINWNSKDWLFLVGIYKSQDKYYLLLDFNNHSSTIDTMIEDGICPNTGCKLISESVAIEFAEKISKLGKEYFSIDIPYFGEIMNAMVLSMKCKVVFTPLLNCGGYFNRVNKEIVVANNRSQFGMMWALVHEYVHYLLNSEEEPPSTIKEYECDPREYLCETVAFKFMNYILDDDGILSICISPFVDLTSCESNSLNQYDSILSRFHDAVYIMDYLFIRRKIFEDNAELQNTIKSFYNKICDDFESEFYKNSEMCIDCAQTGLVLLSPDDNKSLYDMIINEISPMFPDDDYSDEDG